MWTGEQIRCKDSKNYAFECTVHVGEVEELLTDHIGPYGGGD